MKKYPHGLTLNAVCAAIDDYQRHEDSVPEEGILAAFNTLLGHSDIAEAIRALEQRAEAAEAKLAELEKQEPVGWMTGVEVDELHRGIADEAYIYRRADATSTIPLFTRPSQND